MDEKLDQLDLISTSYYLEVSSQDLSRPLKTDRDLIRNMNELLKVKLKDGSELIAFTKEVNADNILFISQDDEEIKIDKSDIKEIKIEIVF